MFQRYKGTQIIIIIRISKFSTMTPVSFRIKTKMFTIINFKNVFT